VILLFQELFCIVNNLIPDEDNSFFINHLNKNTNRLIEDMDNIKNIRLTSKLSKLRAYKTLEPIKFINPNSSISSLKKVFIQLALNSSITEIEHENFKNIVDDILNDPKICSYSSRDIVKSLALDAKIEFDNLFIKYNEIKDLNKNKPSYY
jgi:hypothetical protein